MSKLLNRRLLIFEKQLVAAYCKLLVKCSWNTNDWKYENIFHGVSEGERIGSSEVVSWLRSSEAAPSKCLSSEEVQWMTENKNNWKCIEWAKTCDEIAALLYWDRNVCLSQFINCNWQLDAENVLLDLAEQEMLKYLACSGPCSKCDNPSFAELLIEARVNRLSPSPPNLWVTTPISSCTLCCIIYDIKYCRVMDVYCVADNDP